MSDSSAAHAWHADQRTRITGYRPARPQMPADHRCPPSGCSEPPPSLPAGVEGFVDASQPLLIGLVAVAVASIAVILAARKRV